jgi:nicotinamide phosphoribosyltransferase
MLLNDMMRARATLDTEGRIIGYAPLLDNNVTDTDSYKSGHPWQYVPGMRGMHSYFASRGGYHRYSMFTGLQPMMLRYMTRPVTMNDVREAADLFGDHGDPFNREDWEHLVTHYDGRPPIRICAVPEGTVVPTGNVLYTVETTTDDPRVAWLPNWFETKDVRIWYPTTVATRGYYLKEKCLEAAIESADDPLGWAEWAVHCFGGRGGSSMETVQIGGAAHLINFKGSDTMEAVRHVRHYYGENAPSGSVPAAEHSTVTSWGREHEEDFYEHFVKTWLYGQNPQGKKYKIAACVSDTYDYFNTIENMWFGERLHNLVRESGGKLVIRPDSGTPKDVDIKSLQVEERKLGMRKNTKDYKVGPSYFGFLQGDGINEESAPEILREVMSRKYSVSGISFGMGGGGLQDMTRDTQKFALKASAVQLKDGSWMGVAKDPKTDRTKASMPGRLALVHEAGRYATVEAPRKDNLLVPVYENGRVLKTYTFEEVRANAMKGLV